MVEKILGKDVADDIFYSAMITGMMTEKEAEAALSGMEKDAAFSWKSLLSLLSSSAITGVKGFFKSVPALVVTGAGAGALAGAAYNSYKARMTEEDPEERLNNKLEAMYTNKAREAADAKWMVMARAARDDLMRNYKKMTPQEYSEKYHALVDLLNERAA